MAGIDIIEEAGRFVPWWVVWLPGLYPLLIYGLSRAGAWITMRAALVPMKRATEGHWTDRARHVYPALTSGSLIVIVLPTSLAYIAAKFTGPLSTIPPWLVAVGAGVAAFMGTYVGVWRVSRRFRAIPLSLGRSLTEYGVLMSVQMLPFLIAIGLAALAAPSTWMECVAVGVCICLVGVLLHRGAGLAPGRLAGVVRGPEPRLTRLVEAAAAEMRIKPPIVEQADLQMANAFALPLAGRLLFTTSLVRLLDDEEILAITRHELAHLREPHRVKAARFAPVVALAFLVFVPVFVARGEWLVALPFLLVPLIVIATISTFARGWEASADQHATHGAPSPAYARALEKLYEANLFPAVHGRKTHPDLYSRMVAAGVSPSFPKPAPPREWRGFLSLVLGAVVACGPFLGLMLTQILSDEMCVAAGTSRCLVSLGMSYEQEGRPAEATAALYRAAAFLDPSRADLLGHVASDQANRGECEKAAADLDGMRRLPPPGFEHADSWVRSIEYEVANCFALRRGETLPPPDTLY